uniref:E4 n=1 Tax=Mouse papillomavirus 1 TaxID=2171376 RepID=A0A2S0SZ24_9PAPI|nr:E4 [Mouse papillomavirus 1]
MNHPLAPRSGQWLKLAVRCMTALSRMGLLKKVARRWKSIMEEMKIIMCLICSGSMSMPRMRTATGISIRAIVTIMVYITLTTVGPVSIIMILTVILADMGIILTGL